MSDSALLRIGILNVESRRTPLEVANDSKDVRVVQTAQKILQASPYFGIRTLLCEYHEGVLVLRGRVPSYYHKQMAQEAVRKVSGVELILNAVVVDPSPRHIRF